MYSFKFNLYEAIKTLKQCLDEDNLSKSTSTTTTQSSSDNNNKNNYQDYKCFESIFKKSELEYTSNDKLFILSELSKIMMTNSHQTSLISRIFRPLLIDLVSRYLMNHSNDHHSQMKNQSDSSIENISFIFSQLLPTTPQLIGIISQFYQNKPSIFEQITLITNISKEKEEKWIRLVQTAYRLLTFNRKVFSSLWNWSPLFSLLEIKSSRIRWYVIKCMSMILNISDNQIEQLRPYYQEYHHEIIQVEKDILNLESSILILNQSPTSTSSSPISSSHFSNIDNNNNNSTNQNIYVQKEDLHSSIIDVCGILLYKNFSINNNNNNNQKQQQTEQQQQQELVYTPTVCQNLNSLAIAVGLGKPILMEGVTGSGKTTMVEEISRITGNNGNLIKIHLGDQTDSKVLLGTYIASDTPGEFKWQSGALTQAVVEGRWILIEDIDLAPMEVLSVLIPLLENRTLFIPGRGEVIEAATGFQLFATQTLFGTHSRDQNANILSHLWTRVVIEALSPSEMKQVLQTLFPQLFSIVPKFIDTFNLLLRVISNTTSVSDVPTTENSTTDKTNERFIISSSRFLSSRDLIKWIKRCNQRLAHTNVNQHFTSTMQEIVFVEALDCFCSMIAKKNLRNKLTEVIGRVWDLTPDRIQYYIELYKPSISITPTTGLTIGRANLAPLEKSDAVQVHTKKHTMKQITNNEAGFTKHGTFAHTMNSLRLMEKISISVQFNEPILLVGETGTGKTSVIQYIADQTNQKLIVLNLNQQSDSSDLIGGFKPVEMRLLCAPLKTRFDSLFKKTFSESSNTDFLDKIEASFVSRNWKNFINLLTKAIKLVENKIQKESEQPSKSSKKGNEESQQKKKTIRPELRAKWKKLSADIIKLSIQFEKSKNNFAFSFVEGSLVNAIRQGYWVLLDEMNLATSETLESLSGLFDGGSLTLTEKGEVEPVERHPNFKVFACMNPPTDIGKKDLPPGIRNRFTEYYVDELENRGDLCLVVKTLLQDLTLHPPIEDIVDFYLTAKKEAATRLVDGSNQKPHFSLRTLSRALHYTKHVCKQFGFQRALFEGISMSFLTQLSRQSYPMMEQIIKQFIKKGDNKFYSQPITKPQGDSHIQIEQFWVEIGEFAPIVPSHYILTPSIKANLNNLSRILVSRKHPILLQGPTSSGKTSMVEYLAQRTGHRFIRINNHEHTDLQEYLGQYISDDKGKLVFQEGILVEAVRKGYWVVLDELNLAPSEVLEALNRLLDDNRELFIPETQETVKPHPHFMLFATQNPPGLYGGRKVLSRAFRNRFLELHIDDIPENELEEILSKRCALPPSYCKKLVAIMRELQLNRQGSSQVFAGKHGYITFRDLFRWAERNPSSYEELGVAGYMLLAERLRKEEEKTVIKNVIEKHLKITLDMESIYACDETLEFKKILEILADQQHHTSHLEKIVWTRSMKRLFTLVGRCLQYKEPILLVGETGCSKTTICQLYSMLHQQKLHILNCHQHTETADFIGGLRPVRGRDQVLIQIYGLVQQFYNSVQQLDIDDLLLPKLPVSNPDELQSIPIKDLMESYILECFKSLQSKSEEINQAILAASTTEMEIESTTNSTKKPPKKKSKNNQSKTIQPTNNKSLELAEIEKLLLVLKEIDKTYTQYCSLFNWVDGPLVDAMKEGNYFLIDEISLAEDAVLERLNSVLEPSRLLVLAEKGGLQIEELRGHQNFRILATMNPGGDFGKKELSPAMRNRFTEIWVPAISSHADLLQIIEERFNHPELKGKGSMLLDFIEYLLTIQKNKRVISLRDILSWIGFMNMAMDKKLLTPNLSYIHGACLVLLDGFGMGSNSTSEAEGVKLREACLNRLLNQIQDEEERELIRKSVFNNEPVNIVRESTRFGIHPFYITPRSADIPKLQFSLSAPTTSNNALRVLRGMQIPRAILIEGSPGVGKTSLITAIANSSGHRLVRINLSEQTDIMDLLGSDLPVEGGTGGQFEWRDGVFLEALKQGYWVLLDELNLASQTVLEGLNSCLDHRSEVYIPELGKTFACHPNFRVFACQNPLHQGGGRKGLPKSFLNRFTQVFIDQLDQNDYLFICKAMYPQITSELLENMIQFNTALLRESMVEYKFGRKGAPWEFNLRDIFRWCDLIVKDPSSLANPGRFIDLIYLQRLRTPQDRDYVKILFNKIFPTECHVNFESNKLPHYSITPNYLQIGGSILSRNSSHAHDDYSNTNSDNIQLLQRLLNPMESLMKCVEMNWMSILIGPTSSSKTSTIRLLAQLTGNTLYQFSMNSSVDTTELLGGFEQIDVNRYQKKIISSTLSLINHISSGILLLLNNNEKPTKSKKKASTSTDEEHLHSCIASIQDIYQIWTIFTSRAKILNENSHREKNQSNTLVDMEQLNILSQILVDLEKVTTKFTLPTEYFEEIQSIKSQIERLKTIEKDSVTGCFEWIDGLLIKALETGAWIVIDNVNFCNPTVLDRLNPLLEQDGVLMLNERGMVDGKVKVIKPHKNFRIFLTMDDRKGEISRAMRNRGIEIYMFEPEILNMDNQRLLTSLGIPIASLTKLMTQFHQQIYTRLGSTIENPITLSQLLYWGNLMLDQLQRGFTLAQSIQNSMEQVYIRPRRHINQRNQIRSIFTELFNDQSLQKDIIDSPIECVGFYPNFIRGQDYITDSVNATLEKDTAFFQHYQSLLLGSQDDESTTLQLLRYLQLSGQYFIETTNANNFQDRLKWITLHESTLGNSKLISNTDSTIQVSMKRLFSHQIYTDMEKNLLQLLAKLNLNGVESKHFIKYQGHQWRNNDELFALIQEKVQNFQTTEDSMISVKDLWNQVKSQMEIIKLFMSYILQMTHQDSQFEKYSSQKPISTAKSLQKIPPMIQSYFYSKKLVQKDILSNDIITLIYPFFRYIEDQIEEWLLQSSGNNATQLDRFGNLIKLKNNYWNSLNSTTFNIGEFIIRWKWLLKEIRQLIQISSVSLKLNMNTQTIMEKIQEMISQYSNGTNRLWKVGGHPMVMKTEHLAKIDSEFLSLIDRIQYTFNKNDSPLTHPIGAIDKQWKDTLIEAITTLYWFNSNQVNNKEENPEKQNLINSIGEIPTSLLTKLKDHISLKQQGSSTLSDILGTGASTAESANDNNSMETENGQIYFDMVSLKHHSYGMWPLIDYTLHLKESRIISSLVQVQFICHMEFSNGTMKSSVIPILESIHADLKQIVHQYNESSLPRSPYHIVFYQKLVWMIDGALLDGNNIGIIELQSIIHSILYFWNQSLWNNSFNNLSYVGKNSIPFYQYRLQTKNEIAKLDTNPLDTVKLGYGPPRLFQNVQSAFSFYLTCDWNHVSIAQVPAKIEQLNEMMQLLSSNSENNSLALENEWKQQFTILISTISSFYKSFLDQSQRQKLMDQIYQLYNSTFKGIQVDNSSQLIDSISKSLVNSQEKFFNDKAKQLLLPCLEILKKWSTSSKDIMQLGKFSLFLASFRLIMFMPANPIDPTQKYNVVMQFNKEISNQLEDEIHVRKSIEQELTGKSSNMVIDELESQNSGIDLLLSIQEKKLTLRPSPPQFDALYRDISQFFNSFARVDKIVEIATLFEQQSQDINGLLNGESKNQMVFNTESMWQEKANHFIQSVEKKYYNRYRDILVPIVTSVYQMKYGLRLMCDSFTQILKNIQSNGAIENLQRVNTALSKFPKSENPLEMCNLLLDNDTITRIKDMMRFNQVNNEDSCNGGMQNSKLIALLLRSALCQMYNTLVSTNHLTRQHVEMVDAIFRIFVEEWKFQEEQKRKKEELKNQQFKYKVKSHKMETKEEHDEKVFLSSFPNFYKEFADLETSVMNEDQMEQDDDDEKAANTEPNEELEEDDSMFFKTSINNEEIRQLCKIHQLIFKHLDGIPIPSSGSEWVLSENDRLELFQLFYQSSYLLMKVLNQRGGLSDFDQQSLGSHILSAQFLKDKLSTRPPALVSYSKLDSNFKFLNTASYLSQKSQNFFSRHGNDNVISQNKVYNIYTDANVAEIGIIRQPLDEFRQRVTGQLLVEFPEHPNLILIVKLIDRLLEYPTTDPIVKILTGLELLLRKSLEWESFASKALSVSDHLDKISRLITRWRKLEIESWPTIFQNQEREFEIKALKSWFILYNMLNDEPKLDTADNDDEKSKEEHLNKTLDEMFKNLQEFIFSSCIGDFLTRLELLKSFQLQLDSTIKIINNPTQTIYKQRLSTIIFNIHKYFSNFIPRFENKLAREIKPIEEKAIEFIRLSRWEDNKLLKQYDRLKSHIEKSHRNLAKITIKYKAVLTLSLMDIFSTTDNELDLSAMVLPTIGIQSKSKPTRSKSKSTPIVNSGKIEDFSDWLSVKGNRFLAKDSNEPTKIKLNDPELESVFNFKNEELRYNKLPQLFKAMKSICKENLLESDSFEIVREGVDAMNEMSTDIIERINYLSNEKNEVNRKEKELALHSLMTKLGDLGISYRMSQYPIEQLQISYLFNVPNLHVDQLPTVSGNNATLVDNGSNLVDQSNTYFYRIINRVHRLRQLSLEFNPDLSNREVQKTGGFVEHLLSLVISQRRQLSESIQQWNSLVSFIRLFSFSGKDQEDDKSIVANQSLLSKWIDTQRTLYNHLVELINEISLLASKIPSLDVQINSELISIRQTLTDGRNILGNHQSRYRLIFQLLNQKSTLLTTSSVLLLDNNFTKLNTIKQKISSLLDNPDTKLDSFIRTPLSSIITTIQSNIDNWKQDFNQHFSITTETQQTLSNEQKDSIKEFLDQFNSIVELMLVSIQNVKNLAGSIVKSNDDIDVNANPDGEILEYRIEHGHIMKLHQHLNQQTNRLKLDQLIQLFVKLHELITRSTVPHSASILNIFKQMLTQVHPLLSQYMLIVNQCMLDSFSFQKTLCKLEYIMTGVFIQLYTKGFCKTETESKESEEGEGKLEDDVEGTGMGEGQGKKDVSDEIQDEGQLLGTNTEEKEEKDEDEEKEDKDKDEGFDMENDFEGDIHDIKKDDEKEDDDKKDQEEEEEPDKEMGDLEQPEDNVVDEKLWAEEDVQDDEEQQEEGQGTETNSEEMMGKNDKEDDKKKKDDKKKDEKKKEDDKQQQPNQDDQEPQQEFDEDGDEDGEGAQEEDDNVVNDEQDKEENHMDVRDDEQLEIPDDLELEPSSGEEDEGEGEDPEKEDTSALTSNDQIDEIPKDSQQPLGVKDKTGSKSNVSNMDEEMKEEPPKDDENTTDEKGAMLPMASDQDSGSMKNLKNNQPPPSSQPPQSKKPPQQKVDPNPYRSIGDAQKEWKKRLNLLQEEENNDEDVSPEEKAPKSDENNKGTDENQAYEFKKDDQDDKSLESEQALASATDSQLQDIPKQGEEGQDEQEMDEDDVMDVDDEDRSKDQKVDHQDDASNQPLDQNKKISISKLQDKQPQKKEEEKLKDPKEKNLDGKEDDKDGIDVDVKNQPENITNLDNAKEDTDLQEEEEEEDEEEDVEQKKLTREDLDQMRKDLEEFKLENSSKNNPEYGNELWKKYEQLTNDLSQDLCEQLRLILEPTLATKLQGDYKTGKRINMKKVIPYIASQFKKDKIWLRRTKPNKRQYQVLLAIDDTESMSIYHSGQFALEALTMISRAMARLEVGQLGIVRFGQDVNLVHSFDQVFSDQSGPDVITQFNFKQNTTDMVTFLSKTIQIMEMNKQQQGSDALQLMFIVSDGWSLRDPESTRKYLRDARNKNIFIVFIVIDNPVNNNSILDFESISFNNGKIQRTKYMSEFPFPYYVILRSLDNLPQILGDTLRQWFEMIKHIE
eukprot:gene2326-2870_t